MLENKELVDKSIAVREQKNDFVKEFSIRFKNTPKGQWEELEAYTKENFRRVYGTPIVDGVKLKFKYVTLYLNGRHSNHKVIRKINASP